jgi:protein-tyrosine phosphatase
MIDLHCHLVPLVDDGAQSIEESMAMIRAYRATGYTGAVCTSHYHPDRYLVTREQVEEGVILLQEACEKERIDFSLYAGHEIYATAHTPAHLREKKALSLANSRYVLLELPFDVTPTALPTMLFQLQLDGFIPIIGHLERYRYVQKHIDWADAIIKNGGLIQLNLWSLAEEAAGSGAYKAGHALLKTNRVHFLSTDAHGSSGRSPAMSPKTSGRSNRSRTRSSEKKKNCRSSFCWKTTKRQPSCAMRSKNCAMPWKGERNNAQMADARRNA